MTNNKTVAGLATDLTVREAIAQLIDMVFDLIVYILFAKSVRR